MKPMKPMKPTNETKEKPCWLKIYTTAQPHFLKLLDILLKKLLELAKRKLNPTKKSTTEQTADIDATLSPEPEVPAPDPPEPEVPAPETQATN